MGGASSVKSSDGGGNGASECAIVSFSCDAIESVDGESQWRRDARCGRWKGHEEQQQQQQICEDKSLAFASTVVASESSRSLCW